jgi:hypothetical protein
MKASTREWIKKAESDWLVAVSLTRRRKIPVHDHACFHFQQSAEKYLKARLEEANLHFPKTLKRGQVFHFAEFQYFDSSVARTLFRSLFSFAFFGNSFSMATNTRAGPRGTGCRPFCARFQDV